MKLELNPDVFVIAWKLVIKFLGQFSAKALQGESQSSLIKFHAHSQN